MRKSLFIKVQKCRSCGKFDFCSIENCKACLNDCFDFTELDGQGTLLSYTTIRRPPEVHASKGIYSVVAVSLKEGISVIGQLENALLNLVIGQKLKAIRVSRGQYFFAGVE